MGVFVMIYDFLRKSAQRDNTPSAAKSAASNQFCFCRASIRAMPKKMTKTAIFVNFMFPMVSDNWLRDTMRERITSSGLCLSFSLRGRRALQLLSATSSSSFANAISSVRCSILFLYSWVEYSVNGLGYLGISIHIHY